MADDTNTAEREALMGLIDAYAASFHVCGDHTYSEKTAAARAELLRAIESKGFDAADMATASAQGFRDGVASLAASAGSEPVAWQCRHLLDVTWQLCDAEVAAIRATRPRKWAVRPLYTHPSPPEGMAGWRPIATAPKDGSRILLHPATEVSDQWSKGHWSAENECWIVGGSPSGVVHTAWAPLPPAPSLPASEAKEL